MPVAEGVSRQRFFNHLSNVLIEVWIRLSDVQTMREHADFSHFSFLKIILGHSTFHQTLVGTTSARRAGSARQ
jgi:hypothetical protein